MFSRKESCKDLASVQRADEGGRKSGCLMTCRWSAWEAVFCDDFSRCALGIIGAFDWPTPVDGWWLNCRAESIDFSDSAIVFLCVGKLYMALYTVFVPVWGDWSVVLSEPNAVSVCSSYTAQYAPYQVQVLCFVL